MKYFIIGILFFVSPAFAAEAEYRFKVEKILGDHREAKLIREGNPGPLEPGIKLWNGDILIAGPNTSIHLRSLKGHTLQVAARSQFKLEEQEDELNGWARFFVPKDSKDKKSLRYRVKTASGSMGVRGTEFIINANNAAGSAELYTLTGSVWIAGTGQLLEKATTIVETGFMSLVRKGENPMAPKPFDRNEIEKNFELLLKDLDLEFLQLAEKGKLEALAPFLKRPMELPVSISAKRLAVLAAANEGHLAILMALVTDTRSLLDTRDDKERSLLLRAANAGHLALVRYLVQEGMDPKAKDKDGKDALQLAESGQHHAVVKFLKENKKP